MKIAIIVISIIIFGFVCFIIGAVTIAEKINKNIVKGNLVLDEFENLPYLNLSSDISELKDKEYITLRVIHNSQKIHRL